MTTGSVDGNLPPQSTISLSSASQKPLLSNEASVNGSGKLNDASDEEQKQHVTEEEAQQHPKSRLNVFLERIGLGYSALAAQMTRKPASLVLLSPSSTFRRMAAAREMVSLQTPSDGPPSLRFSEGVNLPMIGEIRWKAMKEYAVNWLKNPKNLALLAWILAVAVSGAILFMVMVGMLNSAIPSKSARDAWFEVNNQLLNALFMLMCLYLHPQRFLHLYQLYRWQRQDILSLRKIYCKNGIRKPHEWRHMLVVVGLLHLNCFSQYALCGLNWGYKRSERPAIGVAVCLAFAIGCAAAAGIYNTLSPLGRDYVSSEGEEEEGGGVDEIDRVERGEIRVRSHKLHRLLERRKSFAYSDGKCVENPEWKGGVFDCCMDGEVAVLTTLCGFCVFGWNMDRLGFGNRFVHIVTFLLICSSPFWTFLLAAGNIDNKYVRQGLGLAGIVLSVFGLLYGGFWRIKMRSTYGLPPHSWCFGQPNLSDCTQWLFCSLCSLCQEVRTAAQYDVHHEKFYVRERPGRGLGGEDLGSQTQPQSEPPMSTPLASGVVIDNEGGNGCTVAPSPVLLDKD